MNLRTSAIAALAAISLSACAPSGATGAQATTASTARHGYQEPDTGSLFGGTEHNDGLSGGVNDPGMGNRMNGRGD